MGILWFFVCFSDYLEPTKKQEAKCFRFPIGVWRRATSVSWRKTNWCLLFTCSVDRVKKSAQSISRSTKAWKIKHYWQTQIVLKVMWLHVCTKGEEETWYAMLPRCLRPHITVRPNPTSHGSEYGKQLVSSAIWRWPSQNINFFCVFFFSPSNIIRRRPVEAPCCSTLCCSSPAFTFYFSLMWLCPKRYWCRSSPQDSSVKTASANQIKIQINRGKS